jgi:hypothetical protein
VQKKLFGFPGLIEVIYSRENWYGDVGDDENFADQKTG